MRQSVNVKRMAVMFGAILITGAIQLGAAETWTTVSMVDSLCATKVKAEPDAHTRACALQCVAGGYGVLTADGTYLKFDRAGNEKALALLKASKAVDHLRVTVTGTRKGDTITVTALQLAE